MLTGKKKKKKEKGIDADFSRIFESTDPTINARMRVRARRQSSRHAVVDSPFPSSFESTPVAPDHGPMVYPWRHSSILTRKAHAFTAFFTQQLDKHRLLPQLSSRNGYPIETTPLRPAPDLDNSSVSRPPLYGVSLPRTGYHDNHTIKSDKHAGASLSDRSSGLWQRVCHAVNDLYTTYISSPLRFDSTPSYCGFDSSPAPIFDQQAEFSLPKIHPRNDHHSEPSDVEPTLGVKSLPHDGQKVISCDSQDAGASRNPEQVRGSCMAIVVGLVVGIMWF